MGGLGGAGRVLGGFKGGGRAVQYPALSLRLRSPNKPPPTCIQTLNPQIKLGNSNIWAIYLVVYEL